MDLHRSRLTIVRRTWRQEITVQRDGDEVRTERQWLQTWDTENMSSSVVRWEQIAMRISGGTRTVTWNELTRCFAWTSISLISFSYSRA